MNIENVNQIKTDFSLLMRSTQSELTKIKNYNSRLAFAFVVLLLINVSTLGFYFYKNISKSDAATSKSRTK